MNKTQSFTPVTTIRLSLTGGILVLCGVLSACGGGGTTSANAMTEPQAPSVRAGTWVVLGSSTAAGAGATQGMGWVELLRSNLAAQSAQFANIAKGGTVTYHGLSATATPLSGRPLPDPAANIDQALSRSPVMVILAYPTNDTALGYSVEETVNNLLSMRRLALGSSVPVMVLSTQPRNLPSTQLTQLLLINERLAAAVGPCFVDVHKGLAADDGRLAANYDSGDGVHPNDEGHRLITTRVRAVLDAGKCIRVLPD